MPKATKWTGADEQIRDVVVRHRGGATVRAIARHYSCRSSLVADALRAEGYRIHPGREKVLADVKDRIIARYQEGATIRAIAAEVGLKDQGVSDLLTRAGVKTDKWATWTTERYDNLRTMFEAGLSASEIARRTGLSQASVSSRLRMIGVPPQPPRSGALHGSWKGGRVMASGYVYVRPSADDLRVCTPNASGYVAEHRLLLGRSLGRPLLATESVHHVNGQRADNRLENLQLRQGEHGSGVAMVCRTCGSHDIVEAGLV